MTTRRVQARAQIARCNGSPYAAKNFEAHLVIAESVYGSDKYGLVWAYFFAPGESAREVDASFAEEWLAAPEDWPAESFLWLHFSLANTASERWMRAHLEMPDTFYDGLHEPSVTTRLEQEDNALLAAIHDVLFNASFDSSSVSSVNLYLNSRLLVSARRRPLRSVDRLRATIKEERYEFRSSAELFAQLLRDQASVLAEIARQSTARVDAIEDRLLAEQVTVSRRELGSLRRALVRLQRLLAPEPAALFRLLSRPPPWIGEQDLQDLRQAAEEFSAAVADASTLAERVKLLQEEFAALINEQTNRTLFVLTIVTVLALPINLIAGLFGMNVGGIPLSEHRHGFFLIVGCLSVATAILAYFALGRHRD